MSENPYEPPKTPNGRYAYPFRTVEWIVVILVVVIAVALALPLIF